MLAGQGRLKAVREALIELKPLGLRNAEGLTTNAINQLFLRITANLFRLQAAPT